MKVYIQLAKISFKNNLVFRTEFIFGLLNTIITIFVAIVIWEAIYGGVPAYDGIRLDNVVSYISLAVLLHSTFSMDDFYIDRKMRTGAMAIDLMRPINFRFAVMSHNLGNLFFKLCLQLLPSFFITMLIFDLLLPKTFMSGLYFLVSVALGYLVLYNLNFIFWVSSFWFHVSWSIITIKEAVIVVLSGAIFPIWFMPAKLQTLIKFTPFDSILFVPISIYLDSIKENDILFVLIKQVAWIIFLYLIGSFFMNRGMKKLTLQGG